MLADRTRNRFCTIDGFSMKRAQLDGMLVVAGSSSVSFNRIAVKSKVRERSKM